MTGEVSDDKAAAVPATLARPDVHQEWIDAFRRDDVIRFTGRALARLLGHIELPAGSRVLDAGCGSGTNTIWLARRGLAVTGADFSDFALDAASRAVKDAGVAASVELQRADLTRLPFPDASFDAVFCIGVLMHIPQVELAIEELCRVLRPQGFLILGETNADAPETHAFRAYWRLARKPIRVERNASGVDVWSETSAGALLSRKTSIRWLVEELAMRRLVLIHRMTGELTEIFIYVPDALRRIIHGLNELWFKLRGPPSLAVGNLLAFRKAP